METLMAAHWRMPHKVEFWVSPSPDEVAWVVNNCSPWFLKFSLVLKHFHYEWRMKILELNVINYHETAVVSCIYNTHDIPVVNFSTHCFRRSLKRVRRNDIANFFHHQRLFKGTLARRWENSSKSHTSADHVSWWRFNFILIIKVWQIVLAQSSNKLPVISVKSFSPQVTAIKAGFIALNNLNYF